MIETKNLADDGSYLLVPANSQSTLALPSGFPLDTVTFARAGDDLVIIPPQGPGVIVQGYFTELPLRDLDVTGGMSLSGEAIETLVAGEPYWGRLHAFQGGVDIFDADGNAHEPTLDEILAPGEAVTTSPGASAAIMLPDGAVVTMGANSRLHADPTGIAGSRECTICADRGEFTLLAGHGAAQPTVLQLTTPHGVILLSGGQLGLHLDGGLSAVLMQTANRISASAAITHASGTSTLRAPHESFTLGTDGVVGDITLADETKVVTLYSDSLLQLPRLNPAANDYGLQIEPESGSAEDVSSPDIAPRFSPVQQMTVLAPLAPGETPASRTTPQTGDTASDERRPVPPVSSDVGAHPAVPADAPPVAFPETIVTREDEAYGGILSASDPEQGSLTFAIAEGGEPANGSVVIDPAGNYIYVPAPDFSGSDSFTFQVTDEAGASTKQTVSVSITAVADTPSLNVSDAEIPGEGEPGPQTLVGTSRSDTLVGGGGDDVVTGRGGADLIYGDEPRASTPLSVPLDIQAALSDTDGSELMRIEISGLPEGAALSAGTDMGGGTWTLGAEDLSGLSLELPAGHDTDVALSVSAFATDTDPATGEQDTVVSTAPLDVTFDAGPDGADIIEGGGGDDVIYGGGGADDISGGSGGDEIYGGRGNDALAGDGGADLIYGDDGADIIEGGKLADTLYGGAGDDNLYGDGGSDTLLGGDGDDLIAGGRGNDILAGGNGNNQFVFDQRSGRDVIIDFEQGDALRFEGPRFDPDQLSIETVDNNTIVTFGNVRGVEVTLEDIDLPGDGYTITQDPDALIITYDEKD